MSHVLSATTELTGVISKRVAQGVLQFVLIASAYRKLTSAESDDELKAPTPRQRYDAAVGAVEQKGAVQDTAEFRHFVLVSSDWPPGRYVPPDWFKNAATAVFDEMAEFEFLPRIAPQ